VARAYGWARVRRLPLRAYVGPLRAGRASTWLANYRITVQRPAAGGKLGFSPRLIDRKRGHVRPSPVTVWGRQPPPAPPRAQTGTASAGGLTTATLTGAVNPEGSPTSYYFSYGPTSAYGNQTAPLAAGAGTSSTPASAALSGLTPATTYHYRLIAVSRAGTSYGADRTVTTSGYYQNAVYSAAAFPDPFVLDNGDRHSDYWAFATGDLFPILHSTDLVNWSAHGTAMTARPAWVLASGDWHPWGPSVLRTDERCPDATASGCYVMYYVGLSSQLGANCIGVATAPSPGGPYTDLGPLELAGSTDPSAPPIGCGDDTGQGNIDPSLFVDPSGQAYLYVSTDRVCGGRSCMLQPTISAIPLTADLQHAAGPRLPLFSGDSGTWEADGVSAPTVEGPSLALHDGTYYLFYSGGNWQGTYAMGYATAPSPTGPFTKSASNPILTATATVLGPAGGDRLVTGPHGGLWLVYAGRDSSYTEPRTLRLDQFSWEPAAGGAPDVPVIHGPTSTPQPVQP
jgi:hypothetical protein